jgi:hypothetical protein
VPVTGKSPPRRRGSLPGSENGGGPGS